MHNPRRQTAKRGDSGSCGQEEGEHQDGIQLAADLLRETGAIVPLHVTEDRER